MRWSDPAANVAAPDANALREATATHDDDLENAVNLTEATADTSWEFHTSPLGPFQ